MTTMSGGARATLPRVSYIKAIDVWMIVSLVLQSVAPLILSFAPYLHIYIALTFLSPSTFYFSSIVKLRSVTFYTSKRVRISPLSTSRQVSFRLSAADQLIYRSILPLCRWPTTSGPVLVDVWMIVCLVFVFASLIEYAVVNVIARRPAAAATARGPAAVPAAADGGGGRAPATVSRSVAAADRAVAARSRWKRAAAAQSSTDAADDNPLQPVCRSPC